jgi:uncharacterized protein (DUF1697 family)
MKNNDMEKINYLVLLRGINVGGNNIIKMGELKELFEKMRFVEVKTYIQSGNVLFMTYEKDKTKIAKEIEEKIFDKLDYKINALILQLSDMENIIKNIPVNFGVESEKYKYDVIFLIEPLTTKEVLEKITKREGDDEIYEGEKVFYIKRSIAKLTGSFLTKIMKTPIWQNITIRNWNTTRKLYELMLERKI